MADLPLPQIREKKFRQQEIDLNQFTDEELCSRYRFGRESIQYLVEILKNDLERQTRRKHKQLPTGLLLHVINLVIIKHGLRTVDCGLNIRYGEFRFPLLLLWFNLDHFIFRHFPLLHPCLNIFRAIFFKSNHPKN